MSDNLGRQVVTWCPPIVLPSGGNAYVSLDHLERVIEAWARTQAGVVLYKIHRIDLARNEILYETSNGNACTLTVPTDKRPNIEPEVIKGWAV